MLEVYDSPLISSLLDGCETWTFKQRDLRRLKATKMKCLRPTEGNVLLQHGKN
jgi:hypothetical protein